MFAQFGGLSDDIVVELFEKIELAIITSNLKNFLPHELIAVTTIFASRNLGTK